MEVMNQFFIHGSIHHTCSASFIALIPKVNDPMTPSEFRPISLIGVVNKIISKVLANRIKEVIKSVISNAQSAFVSDRNIVDGPLVINEIVAWAKRSKKSILVFKADIEKAYDTLNWKFLISILTYMGFPAKWRNWVMGILFAGRGSILVNGSPTGEFQYRRGLRQGDPLSPFLFIVAMEGLHILMERAKNASMFSGVKLPGNGPYVTHMLFADDSIFIGEWKEENIMNLKRILRIFHLASGLKVNPRKSQLFGVCCSETEVENMAGIFKCKPSKFPFTYLGLKVGANMNRIVNWKDVIDTFNKRLSNWKAKNLSFAGRVILIKSVLGSLPNYYLSLYKCPKTVLKTLEGIRRKFLWGGSNMMNKIRWVRWERIVASKDFGGLGIGSIKDLNLALLLKWWWRLKMEPNQIWASVVKAIHGSKRKIMTIPVKKSHTGVWKNIGEIETEFAKNNINISSCLRSEVGIGDRTMFWEDAWLGSEPLRLQYQEIYQLAKDKGVLVSECYKAFNGGRIWEWAWQRAPATSSEKKELDELNNRLVHYPIKVSSDIWYWKDEQQLTFTVKAVREALAQQMDLNTQASDFMWNKWASSKSNMFAWRAIDNKIPTAAALSERGMIVQNNRCKMCDIEEETADHVLLVCTFAKRVWEAIFGWMKCSEIRCSDSLRQVFQNVSELQRGRNKRKIIHAIALETIWKLWKARNDKIFKDKPGEIRNVVEDIKEESYQYVKERSRFKAISKQQWWDFNFDTE
ncbi:putative RNA-directed DNA polymerase [Helianthus annuus]|nr:putative RNA-directed DNA polymerase [Helianthus annuus]